MATKLVNLARTPEEIAEQQTACTPIAGNVPEYPYGTCITLNGDALDKLGLTRLPPVGSTVGITAVAKVSRVSETEMADGSAERCLELQITDMAIGKGASSADASEKLYPKKA